jgi:beta-xylosidase
MLKKLGILILAFVLNLGWVFSKGTQVQSRIYSLTDTIAVADPTIFLDKGIYYLYGTSSDEGFLVYQSTDLKKWSGPVGKNSGGFALSKGESFGTKGFWAPQVFKQGAKYFMAYTANERIAIAESDSPLGPFRQKELKPLPADGLQIDPFVFKDTDGKFYLYHVRLSKGNRIFVAELKADFSAVMEETLKECITATQPWENTQAVNWSVTEGPTVIKKGSLYYLFYSANDFRNIDYAVGYAISFSPYGPWKKVTQNPILSRNNIGFNGTGHGDFFTDKAGKIKYVFHTHRSTKKVSPRLTAIVDVKIVKNSPELDWQVIPSTLKFLTQ